MVESSENERQQMALADHPHFAYVRIDPPTNECTKLLSVVLLPLCSSVEYVAHEAMSFNKLSTTIDGC
jgi:hypothetical protein